MNYVSVENLTKSYGIKTLFKNVSFHVNEGDKIAIVAKNGSGKSTLLKILMGKEIADSGSVVINKDIQVVLFDQEIDFESDLTIDEFMMTLDSAPILALKNTIMLWFRVIRMRWKLRLQKWRFTKHGIWKMK